MDSDLPGSEKPGAILDYVKESKEKEKVENKEINVKELKKKIFETFVNAEKILVEDEYDEYTDNKLVELLKYENGITQDLYETIRLSDPSKVKAFYAKLATKKESDYVGPIIEIKVKENYEPNQFIIKLKNGIEVTYDKKYIRKKDDKHKKIEEIVNYFENAKNNKYFYINLKLIEYYIGQRIIREPYVVDYYEWEIWNKYKEIIKDKKEKYSLTFYEYFICGMLGLNPFDLEGKEKETFDLLYIPRVLGLFRVKTPILPKDMVPYTHILQLTPPATGKTQFALSIRDHFNIDYFDKLPSRPKLVYNAQTDVSGSIFKHDYIVIDELTKKRPDAIRDFLDTISTGLSSGYWVIEKGSDKQINVYKPVGFVFFGNTLGDKEIEGIRKINPYFEGIEYEKFENSREASKKILYLGVTNNPDYVSSVNTFIDRIAITSIVLRTLDISKLGILKLVPNPLELYALRDLIQERINEIAKEPNKYLDIEKIDKEKWEDGRMRDNAIKIAIKLRALEIDKYLNRTAEDLAIEMVKGLWGWNPK